MVHLLIALLFSTLAIAAETDPLFSHMVGHWQGLGQRVFFNSGRHVALKADVFTTVTDSRLVSNNSWLEVTEGSEPFQYQRIYWIQPTQDPSLYELGYGTQSRATVIGHFDNQAGRFEVKQTVGNIRVESTTLFSEKGSVYFETTWAGTSKISEATVQYTRVLDSPEN